MLFRSDELDDYAGINPNDEIKDILADAVDQIDQANTKEEVNDSITDTKDKIDEVKNRKTEIKTDDYDDEKDYGDLDLEEGKLIGSVANEKGFEDDISLIIVQVKLQVEQSTNIEKFVDEEKLKIYNNWISSSKLKDQMIFGQLEIKLVDGNGNPVDENTYTGTYIVKFLLPTEMREFKNIRVVYLNTTTNLVEVFNTSRDGDWITFETDHFSTFNLLGDPIVKQIGRASCRERV